jgi:hypothetical protein
MARGVGAWQFGQRSVGIVGEGAESNRTAGGLSVTVRHWPRASGRSNFFYFFFRPSADTVRLTSPSAANDVVRGAW